VSEAFQADDGKWYVALDVHSEVGKFEFSVTPLQAARIAADLLSAWRKWETEMKQPSGPVRIGIKAEAEKS
jgi:hypothetical protein